MEENFVKILVGASRMILCRREDYERLGERGIRKLIRKSFPEVLKWRTIKEKFFGKIGYMIADGKVYSPYFDSKIDFLIERHDWEQAPFVALGLKTEMGTRVCYEWVFFDKNK